MKIKFTLSCLILALPFFLSGQASKLNVGLQFVQQNIDQLKLVESDITNIKVQDMYMTKHNGVTHIYYVQQYADIPVHNAILNVNITKDNDILFHNSTFVSDLESKVNTAKSEITAEASVISLAQKMGVVESEELVLAKKTSAGIHTYNKTDYTDGEITVQKKYFATDDGEVRLVWDIYLSDARNDDTWSSRVDAITGEVIHHENRTVYCSHSPGKYHKHTENCTGNHKSISSIASTQSANSMMMGASYRVYPLPAESPIHGTQELITDPHIQAASPYGWHDLDGVEGAEFTITRGNNVHAYEDTDDAEVSANNEPDGGADLVFDFVHDTNAEPDVNELADVTNLFYMNNMMHDLTYLIGFDEAAGNFQSNNYNNGGTDGDHVVAHALDGSGTNNANFNLTNDGNNGNMNMFRWDQPTAGLFSIASPEPLEGFYPNGEAGAGWGFDPTYADVDLQGEMAFALDSDPQFPQNGCGDIVNTSEIDGKIALIYRGICEFGRKALNAQNAGAIAVIICNVPGAGGDPTSDGSDPISNGMGGGAVGAEVTIPTIALGFQDCNEIKASIDAGFPVTAILKPSEAQGVAQVSSGFDNGVIAHEYGHGISGRLVGGPSTVCVSGTDEQMGEGWSDFFALITTVRPTDDGAAPKAIGNYVDGRGVTGRGIRRYPYSTDMSINPQTYKDIKATTAPHPLGEVWNDMLWDMYWSIVGEYGYDADWSNTESGNHIAAKLVMDGMKMMGCDVGFITGRNAILAADRANNNGDNQCRIWNAFARRGLGFYADGGSTDNRNDGKENFELLPACTKTLKIRKDIAAIIEAGEEITVTLDISNDKDEDQTNMVVTDFIPAGLSYVEGSASMEANVMGDQIIFEFDTFASEAVATITYNVIATGSTRSQILSSNAVETSQDLAQWQREIGEGTNIWQNINSSIFPTYSGELAWFVQEVDENTQQTINFPNFEVNGAIPVLRFWHRINTEFARNGGFVEISRDNVIWFDAKDKFIRNGYDCPLQYTTFAIPGHFAFSGSNDEYMDSWIDLSEYKGETISVRFRFGTNDGDPDVNDQFSADAGWFIDDLDLIDLVNADSQACVSSVTDNACTPFATTIINTAVVSSLDDLQIEGVEVELFPNPAADYFTMKITSDHSFDGYLSLYGMDGKMVSQRAVNITTSENVVTTNTSQLVSGFYVAQLRSGDRIITRKVIVE